MRRLLGGALVLLVAGCGGGDQPQTGLRWDGTPKVFRAAHLPNDRVVIARVRNVGDRTLHLVAADLVVRDAEGHALKGSAAFTTTFAHGLFGALQQPNPVPPAELIRLGKVIYLPAGASAPFYAAWTLTSATKEPVSVDYGSGSLELPQATATAAG
jgi:hypothetical protein